MNHTKCLAPYIARQNIYRRLNHFRTFCVHSNGLNIDNNFSRLDVSKFQSLRYLSDRKIDKNTSTLKEEKSAEAPTKLSQRARLKLAVRDYGATIVVFHISLALTSLGLSYLAISNGVDAVRLLTFLGFSEDIIQSKVAIGGSTFVIAYAVHKVFAPVRIAITLSIAPFVVRYLRRINWLKPPKPKL